VVEEPLVVEDIEGLEVVVVVVVVEVEIVVRRLGFLVVRSDTRTSVGY